MSDQELIALASLVNGYAAETMAANDTRKMQGYAMAYDGFAGPDALQSLETELIRRGIIQK